jgi:ribulose 1,5-bisphosphate synthetase/thiazole synthase
MKDQFVIYGNRSQILMKKVMDIIAEPARQTPVMEEVEVLVAGGGPTGIAAALAAAREGARTLLVERYGYLGGMITGAHVVAILGAGDGKVPKARGVTLEIRQRLEKFAAVTPLNCGDYRVDAELFKWQVVEMLLESGVNLLFHTLVCEPILEAGAVAGAVTESKTGRQAIRAKVIIDATADADLAFRSGCACDNETHEVTLGIVIQGIDRDKVDAFANQSPDEYQAIVEQATRRNGGVMLGQSRLLKDIDISNAADLTRAEIQLRQECFNALMYLREHLPGYENARIALTRPQIGVRQGRRIRGEYILTDNDLKTSRHFDDGIARLGVYFPTWGPNYAIEGLDYDVPYRCLVPATIDGLLVAGRCISCDYTTCNSLRLIVPCFATGQAAGCAAAIAAKNACTPRQISSQKLRTALLEQDVYLG